MLNICKHIIKNLIQSEAIFNIHDFGFMIKKIYKIQCWRIAEDNLCLSVLNSLLCLFQNDF